MNIAICSPHTADRKQISAYLEAVLKKYALSKSSLQLKSFDTPEAFLASGTTCTALFLMIGSAADLAAAADLKKLRPAPILCLLADTDQYCLDGFDLGAEGYLLRPISAERLEHFFTRRILPVLRDHQTLDIYSNRLLYRLPVKRILYIENIGRKCLIHTARQTYTTNLALTAIEELIRCHDFMRCHRSYLVNLIYVQDILDFTVLLNNGEEVPLTLRKRSHLIRTWHLFLSGAPGGLLPD